MSKVVDVVSNSNDALGTTVGSKSNGKYSAAVLSAFGESLETQHCEATSNFKHQTSNSQTFFTGKPFVKGLGHAFWMRNYRAGLAKWQTADPMGYPDGWNQLAYCNNEVTAHIDLYGCVDIDLFDEGFISDEDKRIKEGAKNYNPEDKVTVAGHGSESGIGICDSGDTVYDVADIANMVRKTEKFKQNNKIPVEIIACYCGMRDWAQWLADELGVSVYACEGKIRITTGGKWVPIGGAMKEFKPKKVAE